MTHICQRCNETWLSNDQATVDKAMTRSQHLPASVDPAVLADQPTLEIADALTDQLRTHDLPTDRLRQVGCWLTEHGTRRHAVAAGIANRRR